MLVEKQYSFTLTAVQYKTADTASANSHCQVGGCCAQSNHIHSMMTSRRACKTHTHIAGTRATPEFFIRPRPRPRPNDRKSRPKADSRGGVLGEGQQPPPHQLEGLGQRCELPQRGSGGTPTVQWFPPIFSTQDGLS